MEEQHKQTSSVADTGDLVETDAPTSVPGWCNDESPEQTPDPEAPTERGTPESKRTFPRADTDDLETDGDAASVPGRNNEESPEHTPDPEAPARERGTQESTKKQELFHYLGVSIPMTAILGFVLQQQAIWGGVDELNQDFDGADDLDQDKNAKAALFCFFVAFVFFVSCTMLSFFEIDNILKGRSLHWEELPGTVPEGRRRKAEYWFHRMGVLIESGLSATILTGLFFFALGMIFVLWNAYYISNGMKIFLTIFAGLYFVWSPFIVRGAYVIANLVGKVVNEA